MDGGIALTPDEVKGRNMWIVWTGGDDRLWDKLTNLTFGTFDLLKILSSYPGLKYSRDNRWNYLGSRQRAVLYQGHRPEPAALWVMARSCVTRIARPTRSRMPRNTLASPSARAARTSRPDPIMDTPTGIVGLRLFPNPAFDEAAAKEWDPERFYDDPNYYLSKELVRPYRVGMSCGFCHVGPNPEKPPAEPRGAAMGEFELDSRRAIFLGRPHLSVERRSSRISLSRFLHTARPGSLDTSLVSSDNINNPRTMNAVYNLAAAARGGQALGPETLGPDNLANKQFNDFVSQGR